MAELCTVTPLHTGQAARRHHAGTARPRDKLTPKPRLFGKFFAARFAGGILRTLFIKLEFILSEWSACMVNRTCYGPRQRRRRAVNAVLSG
jgi:hypothetical protein